MAAPHRAVVRGSLRGIRLVAVLALVASLLPGTALAQDLDGIDIARIAGAERMATAVAASTAFFDAAEEVVLVRADGFADALAGAPLAADRGAPGLLTAPHTGRHDFLRQPTTAAGRSCCSVTGHRSS